MNALKRWGHRLPIAPYWLLIGGLLAAALALFIYHLTTAVTPDRVFLHIPVIEFDIYWYGIVIVSGIGLGSYVVSRLAEERALRLFKTAVPYNLRQKELQTLDLPNPIVEKLQKQNVNTVGDLLLQWGYDPHRLRLKGDELGVVGERLTAVKTIAPVWLTDAPWRIWNPDHTWNGVMWAVVLGVIGARLYHVLTPSPSMEAVGIFSPLDYFRNPYQLINFRNGGLGIYGGIAGGLLGVAIYTRRQRIPFLGWADLAVIGMALGQVFGRWGNFFNQELYGRPSDLPWAVIIDPPYRLAAYADNARFHPAFLYESLWSLLAFAVLLTLHKRVQRNLLAGDLLAIYLAFYAVGRILLETVRLDSRMVAIGGLTLNMAVATLLSIVIALVMLGWRGVVHWRSGKD